MPAKSEKQAKFFRVVKAIKSGDLPKNKGDKATKAAKGMTNKQIDKYTKVAETIQKVLKEKATFTDKYDDNPALTGKQKNLPDPLQKSIINKSKTNEHHLKNNPDAKYVAVYGGSGFFDVWEGEPFDETGEKGVRVARFGSIEDAKDYANTKNAEQGKLEEYEVDISGFEPSDSAKASLEKIKQIKDRRAKAKEPKKSDPTIAQRGGHDKVYKDYLKEDTNRIIALEKKRENLQAELNAINSELEKLQASQQQFKITPTDDLEVIAALSPSHPQFKGDRRYRGPRKNK